MIGIKRLKEMRIERGYTQLQMQLLTGIHQSTYSRIERGVQECTMEQCKKLAIALKTNIDYLVELNDEKKPYPRKEE